jgi:CBS domain-containing protein
MYRFFGYTAERYMTRSVVTVTRNTTLYDLEKLFAERNFNAFPVVEGEEMVGIVTKFDFLKAFAFSTGSILPRYEELMSATANDIMTEAVVDVRPTAPLTRVLQLMVNLRARSFPVRELEGRLVGIIAREDIMRALKDAVQDEPKP